MLFNSVVNFFFLIFKILVYFYVFLGEVWSFEKKKNIWFSLLVILIVLKVVLYYVIVLDNSIFYDVVNVF